MNRVVGYVTSTVPSLHTNEFKKMKSLRSKGSYVYTTTKMAHMYVHVHAANESGAR